MPTYKIGFHFARTESLNSIANTQVRIDTLEPKVEQIPRTGKLATIYQIELMLDVLLGFKDSKACHRNDRQKE